MSHNRRSLRIGIDVGGTNTDAVLIDPTGKVLAAHKSPTTPEVFDGIYAAVAAVVADADTADISQVMLGTTHPVNAIIRRKDLCTVGVLRIAAPATLSVRPFSGWPADLLEMVRGPVEIIEGGHEYSGIEMRPLDEDAVRSFAVACRGKVESIAITGMTSPVNNAHEVRAAEIVESIVGDDVTITLSHEVGGIGLLERENAAILNSALALVGRGVVDGLARAVASHGVDAELYLTQNDGTLLIADEALRRPVLTIGSGPTNSMRGAAFLSGFSDAVVMDIGGTSTDVGLLVDGFPRESSLAVDIGGVRTNFRMPDLISVGIGGGTIVDPNEDDLQVGPDSVGYLLTEKALSFGGDTLTLTDISAVDGRIDLGDNVLPSLPPSLVAEVMARVDEDLAVLTDRIKAARGELPLIAVGGGAHLIPGAIDGISEVFRHEHSNVANAIGAAMAEASGSIDRTFRYADSDRETCLDEAKGFATDEAVRAGADPRTIRITSVVEIPISQAPGDAYRVIIKAVGPLMEPDFADATS